MYKDLCYIKPKIYLNRKFFLSCEELILASYLQSCGKPYQWIYSDGWDFSYDTLSQTLCMGKDSRFANLNTMFGIQKISTRGSKLNSLIGSATEKGMCLIIFAETRYISEEHNYYQKDRSHFYMIRPTVNPDKVVSVVSWLPEYEREVDYSSLEKAYEATNCESYLLTPPIKSEVSLLRQLKKCHSQMTGTDDESNRSYGLAGMDKFIERWRQASGIINDRIEIDELKEVITRRTKFAEFLLSIMDNMDYDPQQRYVIRLYEVAEQCINQWTYFRNSLIRKKSIHNTDLSDLITRLELIRDSEHDMVENFNEFIVYLEGVDDLQNIQVYGRVGAILSEKYSVYVEEGAADLRLLGLDSISIINFIVDIEAEFGIQFMDHELVVDEFATVDAITSKIMEKICEGRSE
ncbi:acyl carrier protein [Paenibacillus xylanexedens]